MNSVRNPDEGISDEERHRRVMPNEDSDGFDFHQGTTPLLVSMPHVGIEVPDDLLSGLTDAARRLPDTDWDVDRLYDFLPTMGASILRARYSRYVVDLNRPPTGESLYPGQTETGICPTALFNGDPIYRPGLAPDSGETQRRIERYWRPYHHRIELELARIRRRFGYAILWDAHSIRSEVPALFAGVLPDFNWGTAGGQSCSPTLAARLLETVRSRRRYSAVVDGRFKGGFITRHYGAPDQGIHAIQLELSQATYLSDNEVRGREVRGREVRDNKGITSKQRLFTEEAGNSEARHKEIRAENLIQFDTDRAADLKTLLKDLIELTLQFYAEA